MLKRLVWLVFLGGAGYLAWAWYQRSQGGDSSHLPQFAPPPYERPTYAPPPPQPAEPQPVAERTLGAAEGAAPPQAEPVETAQTAPIEAESLVADAPDAAEGEPLAGEVMGYCVRCKTKRVISNAHEETTESGRRAARGTCPVCGANMFTFLKDESTSTEQASGA